MKPEKLRKLTSSEQIRKRVVNFKTKNTHGFNRKELKDLLSRFKVEEKEFWDRFGMNTVMVDKNETIYYFTDVSLAITHCIQQQEKLTQYGR
jgi:hypothetical protein